jgi:hypothetical protein
MTRHRTNLFRTDKTPDHDSEQEAIILKVDGIENQKAWVKGDCCSYDIGGSSVGRGPRESVVSSEQGSPMTSNGRCSRF